MKDKPILRGDEAPTITTLNRLKTALLDMRRGYPIYWYWGIIEHYFEGNLGSKAVEILAKDKIIEIKFDEKLNKNLYRLTEKGLQITASFINRQKIRDYGLIGIILISMTLVVALAQYILSYSQFPLF